MRVFRKIVSITGISHSPEAVKSTIHIASTLQRPRTFHVPEAPQTDARKGGELSVAVASSSPLSLFASIICFTGLHTRILTGWGQYQHCSVFPSLRPRPGHVCRASPAIAGPRVVHTPATVAPAAFSQCTAAQTSACSYRVDFRARHQPGPTAQGAQRPAGISDSLIPAVVHTVNGKGKGLTASARGK